MKFVLLAIGVIGCTAANQCDVAVANLKDATAFTDMTCKKYG